MHLSYTGKVVAALAVLFCAGELRAQSAVHEASERRDTLTQAGVTASAKPSQARSAAPVQSAGQADFSRLGMQDLHEAVRSFAGVSIRDYGGIGGIKTVSIRSLGAQHTAVSYDGMAVSDIQSGQVDIGRFSLDNVDMVSVSIGQSDDIFLTARMFASSGTLDIRTMRPVFKEGRSVNGHVQLKAASFGTWNPSLLYEQKLGSRWALSVTGDWLTSDGTYPFKIQNGSIVEKHLRNNSDVDRLRSELNIFGNIGRAGTLNVKGNWVQSERGLPGSVVLYNEKADERLWDRNAFASAAYRTPLGERWELKANAKYSYAWTRYRDLSEQYAGGVEQDDYTQRESYVSAAALFKPVSGLQFSLAEDIFHNSLDSNIPECRFPRRWSSLTALAGQWKGERLTVTGSLLATIITETVSSGSAAPDRRKLSPAISLSYKLFRGSDLRLRASYKNVYRIPTFNDLYYSRVGNTNLLPERASQYNLGLTWSGSLFGGALDYLCASVDGYYNDVKDKIIAIPTLFIWKMQNMGRVKMAGVDLNMSATTRLNAVQSLVLSGNYSFQRAVDVTDPEAKNYRHQIPYTPRHSGSATLSWQNPWVNLGYVLTAVGERYSMQQNIDRNLIDGYCDHTVSASHDFDLGRLGLRLQGEVVNLTDKNYEVVKYYPMPGRSWRITAKLKF